jgi:hypothetical protein
MEKKHPGDRSFFATRKYTIKQQMKRGGADMPRL